MKIRIADLPAGVTEDEIRGLLNDSDDIRHIELIDEGDSENPVAVVELGNDAAALDAVDLVNGRQWKGATLRADKLLY